MSPACKLRVPRSQRSLHVNWEPPFRMFPACKFRVPGLECPPHVNWESPGQNVPRMYIESPPFRMFHACKLSIRFIRNPIQAYSVNVMTHIIALKGTIWQSRTYYTLKGTITCPSPVFNLTKRCYYYACMSVCVCVCICMSAARYQNITSLNVGRLLQNMIWR